jgi:uncharacterized protein YndB with AHSA1/START domain
MWPERIKQMAKDLKFERVFEAPVELVWKAWSEPEMLKKWWGPNMFSAPSAEIDFKVGGKYLLAMSGPMPDGSTMTSYSGGVYKEIVPMEKIVVLDHFADAQGNKIHASQYGLPESFPMESEITMSFEKLDDGKTKLTVYYPNIEGIEGMMLDNMTQGWNQSLDKLGKSL